MLGIGKGCAVDKELGEVEGKGGGYLLGLLVGPFKCSKLGEALGKDEGCFLVEVGGEVEGCLLGEALGLIER